MRIKKIAKWK